MLNWRKEEHDLWEVGQRERAGLLQGRKTVEVYKKKH